MTFLLARSVTSRDGRILAIPELEWYALNRCFVPAVMAMSMMIALSKEKHSEAQEFSRLHDAHHHIESSRTTEEIEKAYPCTASDLLCRSSWT